VPIYMKYDGIDGSVTSKGYEKWIQLESCQLGTHRHMTMPAGRGQNREAASPSVSEIIATKAQDCASTALFKAALWGEGKKVKIDFVKTDDKKVEPYLQVELENTMVSSFNVSGAGGAGHDRPMESLSLNFLKITFVTINMEKDNKTAKPDRAFFDLIGQTGG
jgi:type VI secretion system secreted protein Hcp